VFSSASVRRAERLKDELTAPSPKPKTRPAPMKSRGLQALSVLQYDGGDLAARIKPRCASRPRFAAPMRSPRAPFGQLRRCLAMLERDMTKRTPCTQKRANSPISSRHPS